MNEETSQLVSLALVKAKEFCESYDYDIAESFCRQIVKVDPENDEAWFLLGVACGHTGKEDDALRAFDLAAALTKIPENKAYAFLMKAKVTNG